MNNSKLVSGSSRPPPASWTYYRLLLSPDPPDKRTLFLLPSSESELLSDFKLRKIRWGKVGAPGWKDLIPGMQTFDVTGEAWFTALRVDAAATPGDPEMIFKRVVRATMLVVESWTVPPRGHEDDEEGP